VVGFFGVCMLPQAAGLDPPEKYEHPYLYEYATVLQLQKALRGYFAFYNCERLHQSLSCRTRPQGYLTDVACPAERKSFT